MKKVFILLAVGFEEIEALTVVDCLRRVFIDIKMVSIYKELAVCGAHNITVIADISIDEININEADMIILPGGNPGYINLQNSSKVNDVLDFMFKEGRYISAICAAPSILGKKGFLSNIPACCYPGFENDLCTKVLNNNVVVTDKIITARGMGVSVEFALSIVERLCGREISEKLAVSIIYKEK